MTKQPPTRSKTGFTLMELLVVVSIIAILAAIAIPVITGVQRVADKTKCASGMRQVGGAMGSYMGDNDGRLPGPIWTWQSCWFDGGDTGTLATALGQYLGLSQEAGKTRADVMMCPAWQKGGPYLQDELYLMNTEVMVDDEAINPWGDADLATDDGSPNPEAHGNDFPKKLGAISPRYGLARTWAMQDLDLMSPVKRVPHGIAPKPVHGDVRNTLFLDFHVEPVPVGKVPGE